MPNYVLYETGNAPFCPLRASDWSRENNYRGANMQGIAVDNLFRGLPLAALVTAL